MRAALSQRHHLSTPFSPLFPNISSHPSQEDRTVGETIDDQAIVTSIKTKLLADQEVSGFDINVDSYKGVVTLKGVVDSHDEAAKAIRIAREVSGVQRVESKLFVE